MGEMSIDPVDVKERKADSKGRVRLGPEYASREVRVAVLERLSDTIATTDEGAELTQQAYEGIVEAVPDYKQHHAEVHPVGAEGYADISFTPIGDHSAALWFDDDQTVVYRIVEPVERAEELFRRTVDRTLDDYHDIAPGVRVKYDPGEFEVEFKRADAAIMDPD